MTPATILVLSDAEDFKVKLSLPVVRQGDHVKLCFTVERVRQSRREVLEVVGEYRVASVVFLTDGRQEVTVESTGKAPTWRSVKKRASLPRKLGPTHFPRTVVG